MEKHKKSYLINSFQVDFQAKLRVHTLFNLFQDIADEHAEKIGVGYTFCQQNSVGWVGGAYHLKINRMPKWGDCITIETWPSAATPACAIRDFQVKDDKGNVLINATSQWALIDIERLRPLPLAKHLPHYDFVNDRALVSEFSKIPTPEGTPKTTSFPVHVDDIDINCHVNNALYPTWVLDSFDDAFRQTHEISEMRITFRRPARFGDTISLNTYLDSLTSVSVLTNSDASVEFARIQLSWKEIEK